MTAEAFDLSGAWTGLFNYPIELPPVSFRAKLRDAGGHVSGITTEDGASLGLSGSVSAVIEGRHQGGLLRFTKIYDALEHAAHPIQYEGEIADGGNEVSGEWTIPGIWSGTFLMVRDPGSRTAARQKAETTA